MSGTRMVARGLMLLGGIVLAGCGRDAAAPQTAEVVPQNTTVGQADTQDAGQPGTDDSDATAADTEHAAAPTETSPAAEATLGAAAPDFVATGLDGQSVSLSEYLGEQNIVLAFSRANW